MSETVIQAATEALHRRFGFKVGAYSTKMDGSSASIGMYVGWAG